jgi:hypothetical protein
MKDIKGYEGLYAITTCGKVWSYRSNKFLKDSLDTLDNKGYCFVSLSKKGIAKNYKIHRLVAQAYINNPENKPQVNHKNGVKTDNYISNLEWNTQSENIQHSYDTGLRSFSDKQKARNSETHSKAILQIDKTTGDIVKEWKSAVEVERTLGVWQSNISACCNGKKRYKTAGGYEWRYK